MLRHLSAAAVLLALAAPLRAEPVAADCATLTAALDTFVGYDLTAPPAGPQDGWCVLDGAALRAEGQGRPDLTADRLRLRGMVDGAELVGIEVDLAGLRAAFKASDDTVDDRMRGLFRLQSAELRFAAAVDGSNTLVNLGGGLLRLSGGTELQFSGTMLASGLSPASLLSGSLTAAQVEWRNDGRLLRPLMEVFGERLVDGVGGSSAVDAARLALRHATDNLPDASLTEDTRTELEQALAALPQGRGRLALSLTTSDGIGAARLLMAGLKDDPLGPDALAQVLQGAQIAATWTPGIVP
jgi:hypothetical protein